jgi:subtilase family serine protease
VPAGLAGSVLTVTGLDTAPAYAKPLSSADEVPAGFRNARPCSKYYGQVTAKFRADFKTRLPKFAGQYLPYAVCGYTGPFFRAAYEGNLGVYGAGATVGIVDAYGASTIKFDANHYAVRNGDGSYAPGQYTQMLARPWRGLDVCQSPGSWAGEQTLDVEAVHAMAPAAKIVYSGARSCLNSDLRDAVARLVNQDHVQIISNSYGGAEYGESTGDIRAQEKVLLQAAMEGISVLVSSGDNGDELAATGTVQADYFASDPYATAVGGTSTAINWNGSLLFQTGWGTHKYSLSADGKSWNALGFLYGAGGGASSLFNRPSYQNGVVNSPYRMVPDVAMDADPTTGMLVGETQQFPGGVRYDEYRIGGTSLASPLFAGLTALAVGARGGKGAGFLNPLVYHHQNAFYDVKGASPDPGNVRVDYANSVNAKDGLVYSVRTFNHDSSLSVNSGYDDVTGVGVPKPNWAVVVASS